jgi:hypothetical protein
MAGKKTHSESDGSPQRQTDNDSHHLCQLLLRSIPPGGKKIKKVVNWINRIFIRMLQKFPMAVMQRAGGS